MKVAMICTSDSKGGAAIVTLWLMRALREQGVDATLLVLSKQSGDPHVIAVGTPMGIKRRFVYERGIIFLGNHFDRANLFKTSIANTGFDLSNHPVVQQADIILLSWINQGMLSLDDISKLTHLGKPMVWVMHDMWPMTGVCHISFGCNRYYQECGCCPQLNSNLFNDLSHKVWLKKERLYNTTDIAFAPVSSALAKECSRSGLLSKESITVIHNAFPVDRFYTVPKGILREEPQFTSLLQKIGRLDGNSYSKSHGKRIILMGAARLDSPVKGFEYAVESLNRLGHMRPDLVCNTIAVFFGDIRNPSLLEGIKFPYVFLGPLSSHKHIAELYAMSKVVMSTSVYETLGMTLIEGQASGCLPVTFGSGGQVDIVRHMENGYIAKYKDTDDFAWGLAWALEQEVDSKSLHQSVKDRFGAPEVAKKYIALFQKLLSKSKETSP